MEIRDLTPERWDDLVTLFGSNGACGGCWCMWWRIEKGERWPEVKGASALLAHALRRIRALGGEIAEGYPVKPTKDGKPLPGAFAWTGTRPMFDAQGFQLAGNRDGAKQRVRRALTSKT